MAKYVYTEGGSRISKPVLKTPACKTGALANKSIYALVNRSGMFV